MINYRSELKGWGLAIGFGLVVGALVYLAQIPTMVKEPDGAIVYPSNMDGFSCLRGANWVCTQQGENSCVQFTRLEYVELTDE